MRKAVLRNGSPKRLYVDNGRIFISTWMKLACAHLKTRLITAGVGQCREGLWRVVDYAELHLGSLKRSGTTPDSLSIITSYVELHIRRGKTTALRRFAADLDANRHRMLYVCDSCLSVRNFYREVLHRLGIAPRFSRGDARRQFRKALQEAKEERKSPVLVIDEAHLLSREMLEEIRFLLNTGMDSESVPALLLVGQSELRDALRLQAD